ncbi:MAG: hypothetical protein R3C01_07025 [Planctomycetaceae bacterium]
MPTIDEAEQLKKKLTDRYVVVRSATAELRRFSGLTGRVKTVNMNGRALVEFDGPVDIGWYDIDPSHLEVVAAPQPKAAAGHEKPAAKGEAKPEAKGAPKAGGGSPLDMIRKQAAAKTAEGEAATSAPAGGGAKPSPLDLIRKQAAAKGETAAPVAAAAPEAPAATAPAATPAPAAKGADDTAGLSPLEIIRRQAAAKKS